MEANSIREIIQHVRSNLDTIPFKSLQRNEQEASTEEKVERMQTILKEDPALFLTRWGRYLPPNILQHFAQLKGKTYRNFSCSHCIHD